MYSDRRSVKKHGVKASFNDFEFELIEKICEKHELQKGRLSPS